MQEYKVICIAGKNNIAVNVLDYIMNNIDGHEVLVCVNNDDIGKDTWQKSLLKESQKRGVAVAKLEDLYKHENLVFLSLEYDKIIDTELFKSKRLYNVHFSLLPQYRGMYTSAWPILNNEKKTGVTLHCIDNGIDTGDIIDQIAFKIRLEDTARELYIKYIKYGTELVIKNFDILINGKFSAKVQNKFEATYYSRNSIDYKNLTIDLNQTAINIYNQIRAFSFEEYQIPTVLGEKIIKCEIANTRSRKKAGKIIMRDKKQIIVSTVDYDVILEISDS